MIVQYNLEYLRRKPSKRNFDYTLGGLSEQECRFNVTTHALITVFKHDSFREPTLTVVEHIVVFKT